MRQAASDAEAYFNDLRRSVALRVAPGGKVDRRKIDEEQRATHGLAWVLTYVETLKETANWADRIDAEGKFGEIEQLLCQILFGEYLSQLMGGLPMTQIEIVRPGAPLVLENLTRAHGRFETRLPTVKPKAFLVPGEIEHGIEERLGLHRGQAGSPRRSWSPGRSSTGSR